MVDEQEHALIRWTFQLNWAKAEKLAKGVFVCGGKKELKQNRYRKGVPRESRLKQHPCSGHRQGGDAEGGREEMQEPHAHHSLPSKYQEWKNTIWVDRQHCHTKIENSS